MRALRSKRIVVETSSAASVSPGELKPLADKIGLERRLLNSRAEAAFAPLANLWHQHFQVGAPGCTAGTCMLVNLS